MKIILSLIALIITLACFARDSVHYYGNGIRNVAAPWARSFQGMCHDKDNYYLTQRNYLWKIPRSMAMEDVKNPRSKIAVSKVGIPEYLKAQGANHMGDCDIKDSLVLVPLEGIWPVKIMVFQADTLKLLGAPDLPLEQTDAPWVTVEHADGSILTGTFDIKAGQGIFKHRLSEDFQSLYFVEKFYLKDAEGNHLHIKRVQGAEVVRSRDLIWMVSDSKAGGLYGFSLTTGRLEHRKKIAYSPGFPKYEELEGLDALEDYEQKLSHYKGNLFVTMVNHNIFRPRGFLKLFEY